MNNTYILQRNNSESTPLTLEDLKRIGLLPTDLLWVECQSVYWQHPQDIPELKKVLNEATQPVIKPTKDESLYKYAPIAENETSAYTGKEQVLIKPQLDYNSLNKEKEIPAPVKQNDSTTEMKTAKSIYTQPNNNNLLKENVKEPWIQTRATKDKTEQLESLLKLPLKKIALYAGLVVAGALIMWVIKGPGGKEPKRTQTGSEQTKTVNSVPVEGPSQENSTTTETFDQINNSIKQTTTEPAADQAIAAPRKNEATAKNEVIKKETTPLTNEISVNYPSAVTENKETKKEPLENISSKLQLKLNEYTVAAFGGIRNLKMTLQNNSRYLLDKVSVDLHYLNPEGTVVKTETIDFNSVHPGSEATVAVKKSTRGVKLDYRITRVESKEMVINNSTPEENNQFSKN